MTDKQTDQMKFPTLYSRTSTGAVQQWTIEVQGDSYRTVSGQLGGKLVASAWTRCQPKNVGRANGTTAEQQAELEARAKFKRQTERDYWEDPADIDRNRFVEPMTANKWLERKHKVSFPVYTQPKLDGIRCILSAQGMQSRGGKPIAGAPHIAEYFRDFFAENPDAILDGELYADHLSDDFNHIVSLVKKSKPSPSDLRESRDNISYWVYDFVSEGPRPFGERFRDLSQRLTSYAGLRPDWQPFVLVDTFCVSDEAELDRLYGEFLEAGHEGQMIRLDRPYEHRRTDSLLKRKEFMDEEFELVDIIEGKGNRSGMAGNMVVRLKDGRTCDTGIIGNRSLLREYLHNKERYIGKTATVKFFNYTPDGKLRFPHVKNVGREDYE